MTTELALAIGIIIGLAVGLLIDRNARKERDDKIAELEGELGEVLERGQREIKEGEEAWREN